MTAYMSDRPVFLATDEFVTVPVQGYRTGYVYREPAVPQADEGKQVQHSEVVVPPTVSSYTYSFEEDTGREATYVTSWSILMCAFVFLFHSSTCTAILFNKLSVYASSHCYYEGIVSSHDSCH